MSLACTTVLAVASFNGHRPYISYDGIAHSFKYSGRERTNNQDGTTIEDNRTAGEEAAEDNEDIVGS